MEMKKPMFGTMERKRVQLEINARREMDDIRRGLAELRKRLGTEPDVFQVRTMLRDLLPFVRIVDDWRNMGAEPDIREQTNGAVIGFFISVGFLKPNNWKIIDSEIGLEGLEIRVLRHLDKNNNWSNWSVCLEPVKFRQYGFGFAAY